MRAATGADLRENQYINDQSNIDMIDRMLEFLDIKNVHWQLTAEILFID